MKKHLCLIFGLLFILLIAIGCEDPNVLYEDERISTEAMESVEDYYPFLENTIMEYKGIGNEFAEQEVFFEFIEGNRAQIKVSNPGTTMVKILERSNGELKEVFSEGEISYNKNILDKSGEFENVLLKEPLIKGTTWSNEEGQKRSITGVGIDIKLPYKDLKALEVTTELDDGIRQCDYYVKDIGHVASIYKDGEFEVKTILKNVKKDPYKKEVLFYYPLINKKGIRYIEREIEIPTNEKIEKILEYNLKNPGTSKLLPLMSKDTKINFIELNRGNRIVNVDFSKELLEYMEKYSTMEEKILKSIVSTLGYYYGMDKVYISVDEKAYETESFSIKEDEYFIVDVNYIREFK